METKKVAQANAELAGLTKQQRRIAESVRNLQAMLPVGP